MKKEFYLVEHNIQVIEMIHLVSNLVNILFQPIECEEMILLPNLQELLPLVLDFHGFSMTADGQREYSKWDVLAEEEGFIAVFPEGVPDSPSELRKAF